MLELMFAFFYRVASGAQNGFGYAKKERLRVAFTTLMILTGIAAGTIIYSGNIPLYGKNISALLFLIGIVSAVAVEDSFNDKISLFPSDIHLYETITTGVFVLALCAGGYNMIMIACSVYPSLLIHKGLINTLPGGKFWDTRTDDETGKTYSIPLLNIKIPRMGNGFRIVASMISVLLAIIAYNAGWVISLYPFKILF